MKILHATLLAFTLAATVCSCKKQDLQKKPAPTLETGAVEALTKGKTGKTAQGYFGWELGVGFTASVSGKIQTLKLQLPVTGTYRVTLWKASDQSIVRTEFVENSNISSWNEQSIDPIIIEKNTAYVLSVNVMSCYYFEFSSSTLPFTNQHITLTHYCEALGTNQSYPGIPDMQGAAGLVDFSFLPAE